MGKQEFLQWVTTEKEARGWGVNELSRRAGLSNSYVSNVLNELQNPGPKFYTGIATAFGVAEVDLLRLAGELPPEPGGTDRLALRELWTMLRGMSDTELAEVRRYVRFLRSGNE